MVKSKAAENSGYTLVELMIIVTILAILMTMAVPAFHGYVRDARRTDATAMLQKVIAQEILYYGNFGSTYTDDVKKLGYKAHSGDSAKLLSKDKHYVITLLQCDGTPITDVKQIADCVAAEAEPAAGSSQQNDSACQAFSLDSRGTLGAENSAEETGTEVVNDCWK